MCNPVLPRSCPVCPVCPDELARPRSKMPSDVTKYGKSPWIETLPASRLLGRPRYRGKSETRVAIVGGGLTGCATAYAFAAAGVDVILVKADRIGNGSARSSLRWISDDPKVPFGDLNKLVGLRSARRASQGWRRAALDFTALLRRLDIKCDLQPRSDVAVALTPEQAVAFKRDYTARREAGID